MGYLPPTKNALIVDGSVSIHERRVPKRHSPAVGVRWSSFTFRSAIIEICNFEEKTPCPDIAFGMINVSDSDSECDQRSPARHGKGNPRMAFRSLGTRVPKVGAEIEA